MERVSAPSPTVSRRRAAAGASVTLAATGLVLAGLAARPVVTSTSVELPTVVAALHGSAVLTGLVSAMPPLVFAVGSFAAPPVVARLGVARSLAVAASVAAVGLILRVTVVATSVFLVGTVVALAGIALANVCLPPAVKRYLPGRTGLGTALYTLMLALGTALAAAVTIPFGNLVGGWRAGLGIWAVLAAIAVPPWLAVARRDPDTAASAAGRPTAARATNRATAATDRVRAGVGPGVLDVARTRLGRSVAIMFAGQATSAYVLFAYLPLIAVDQGLSKTTGALLLSWFSLLGIVSAVVPLIAGRMTDHRALIWGLALLWVVGDLGLLLAPGAAWLWVTSAGVGGSLFTLALTMIPLRSATVAGSAALSAFAQGVAYLVAAALVFASGLVQELTGSFDIVLVMLALLMIPVVLAGRRAGRPSVVEDEIG